MSFTKTNLDQNGFEIKNMDQSESLNGKGTSIAVTPDGLYIIVGFSDGTMRVFDKDLKMKASAKIGKNIISDIKINSDGTSAVAGCFDCCIYILSIPELKQ